MSKIIAPNGAVNSYLQDKEKRAMERIQAVLDEEGCFINCSVQVEMSSLGMGVTGSSYIVLAKERIQKERVN